MRLIDADAVLRSLSDDLPYKDRVRRVLIQAPTADAGMELERQRRRDDRKDVHDAEAEE